MNRSSKFNKMSGGLNLNRIRNSIKAIKPIVDTIEDVAKTIDTVNKTVIIPSIPIIKEGIKISGGKGCGVMGSMKEPNKDPASRLRKLAMKAKKVVVGKGLNKAKGGKYKTGDEPVGGKYKTGDETEGSGFRSGSGLENYLKRLPLPVLQMISHLHKGGMLMPIVRMGNHLL